MRCRPARRRSPRSCARAIPRWRCSPTRSARCRTCATSLDPNVLTLFFGALNRERDWAPLMPVLNAVAEKVGDRLRFCVVHDRGVLRCAADAAQAVHADLRLRHLHVAARPVRDLVHAARRHAVQSRQVGPEVHRGRRLPRGVAGEPHRLCRQHRGWPHRLAVPRRRGAARAAAAPGGDAGPGARPGRRGAQLCRRRAHAGLSGGAAHRLVPLAVGAAGRTDQRAVRTDVGAAAACGCTAEP